MTTVCEYPAVFYYEWHPLKTGVYQIHVLFPDLHAAGLPASTAAKDPQDAVQAASEILEMMIEAALEMGIRLPDPTPLEKVSLCRGYIESIKPFRIEAVTISCRPESSIASTTHH